jgi:hypothetical protein
MLPENRRERFTAYAETLYQRLKTGILADLLERILWVPPWDMVDNSNGLSERISGWFLLIRLDR